MVTFGGIVPPRSTWRRSTGSRVWTDCTRWLAPERAGAGRADDEAALAAGPAGALTVRGRCCGSAGLRAQRQLDVIAYLVLAQRLRIAPELVRRPVAVADGDYPGARIDLDDLPIDLLGRRRVFPRRVAARRRGGLAIRFTLGERRSAGDQRGSKDRRRKRERLHVTPHYFFVMS